MACILKITAFCMAITLKQSTYTSSFLCVSNSIWFSTRPNPFYLLYLALIFILIPMWITNTFFYFRMHFRTSILPLVQSILTTNLKNAYNLIDWFIFHLKFASKHFSYIFCAVYAIIHRIRQYTTSFSRYRVFRFINLTFVLLFFWYRF